MKLTISPSWFLVRPKNMNFCTKPVSVATIAMKNMVIPIRACHGATLDLVDDRAPGYKKVKKDIIH